MENITQETGIYHEKQSKQLCALHALNNLFQKKEAFTKNEMDKICQSLSPSEWINPHCSMLGLGNYDVNVIITALQRRALEVVWFDKRKDPSCLQLNYIFGFILNVPTEFQLGFLVLPIQRRHWISIKRINDVYYNLDSKLDFPMSIGKDKQLLSYLTQELNMNDKELFVVVSPENVDKWMKESNQTENEEIIARLPRRCSYHPLDKASLFSSFQHCTGIFDGIRTEKNLFKEPYCYWL